MSETANGYSLIISENSGTCYLKFKGGLGRLEQSEIEELQNIISKQTEGIINYIFDCSDISDISNKCYRPFAMAQHCARSKKSGVVVVIPPNTVLKKILLEKGLIRPQEICSGLDSVGAFVKEIRRKI